MSIYKLGQKYLILALLVLIFSFVLVIPDASASPLTVAASSSPVASAPSSSAVVARGGFEAYSEPSGVATNQGDLLVATGGVSNQPVLKFWSSQGGSSWQGPNLLLPAGYSRSYDSSTSTLPNGNILVVGGAGFGGSPNCPTASGSVFLAKSSNAGASFNTPVIVDNHLQGGGFDDRPFVTTSSNNNVWVGWSHGSAQDACQVIGHNDKVEFATSQNAGSSFSSVFSPSWTLPGASFGVQIAALSHNRAVMSWAQLLNGQVSVEISFISISGSFSSPITVASATAIPRVLPGASFYSFSLPSLTTLNHHRLALTWPQWNGSQSIAKIAIGTDAGTNWNFSTVSPPTGYDILLPAIANAGGGHLRFVYALHGAYGNTMSYQSSDIAVSRSTGIQIGSPAQISLTLPGPGFFELGEFLFVTRFGHNLSTTTVEGDPQASSLQFYTWPTVSKVIPTSPTTTTTSTNLVPNTSTSHASKTPFYLVVLEVLAVVVFVGIVVTWIRMNKN